jgi:uncharacterized protein YejL (UPF0352 family)
MDEDNPNRSRRMVLGGMAGGLLATAVAPGAAQSPANASTPAAHHRG